ncbi:MAG: hypothetical protein PVH40_02255 [Gemmatimonadales bacterium]|jgi:hypothetical protein
MRPFGRIVILATAILAPASVGAQELTVREQLRARGLPPALVDEVSAAAADASAQGLPQGMVVDKAVEGWAKRVPQARIMAVVRQQIQLMSQAREALAARGWDTPAGPMITASAEALGRGISAQQVGAVVEAAPTPEAAGPALRVAAALSAQGLGNEEAVQVVTRAMRRGETPEELLNMPSFARAMRAQGMGIVQIRERLMQGGGAMRGAGPGPGMGTRPPGVPPDPGSGKRTRRP